jgi:hypothetical protein
MPTKTITQLPAATLTAIGDTTVLPVDDADASTRKLTFAELRAKIAAVLTLTGAVTGAATTLNGATSMSTTLADGIVTRAKMANMATQRLLGRGTAGAGIPEEIAIGAGLSLISNVLDVAAPQNAADSATLETHRAFGGF